MSTKIVSADEVRRNLAKILETATYTHERFEIHRHGKPIAFLIGLQDMKLFEALEDAVDNREADEILARIESGEEETHAWEDVKKELASEEESKNMTYEEFVKAAVDQNFRIEAGALADDREDGIKGIVWEFAGLAERAKEFDYKKFLDYADKDRKKREE